MAINARTFQLLYIIRQRALVEDEKTTLDDMGEFIADRRDNAPNLYDKAYIAPSAMDQMVKRMAVGEGLVTRDTHGNIELTVKGSRMADLITDIDACSTYFLDNYKEAVCMAVLRQRERLGQGPVSPRECAVIANISLDSARRGLAAATERGDAEEMREGRATTYSVKSGAPVPRTPVSPDTPALSDNEVEDDKSSSVREALADIDEEDFVPGLDLSDEDVDTLADLLSKEDEEDDEGEALTDPAAAAYEALADHIKTEVTKHADADASWDNVPDEVRVKLFHQATACGMTLAQFLSEISEANRRAMVAALFDPYAS